MHDKPPEPEVRKPADLHEVGKELDHEKLREEFELFPDHHKIDNAVHWSGITALKQGIKLGNNTYVKTTLDLGADVNRTLKGSRPIHFSAAHCPFREQVQIGKTLVEHGASVVDVNEAGINLSLRCENVATLVYELRRVVVTKRRCRRERATRWVTRRRLYTKLRYDLR